VLSTRNISTFRGFLGSSVSGIQGDVTRATGGNAIVPDDAEIRRRLGERIRQLREERGLTQQALGERAGRRTSQKHIGAIERGESAPRATLLVRIARALDVTVGELFSTITPGQRPPLARRRITIARENLRSLEEFVNAIDRPPTPSESASAYELRRSSGVARRFGTRRPGAPREDIDR
jgi:transcriptional regulator with XRE-family HTH domain